MGEPGGLPSMGLHRVGHNWSDLAAAAAAAAALFWYKNWITVVQGNKTIDQSHLWTEIDSKYLLTAQIHSALCKNHYVSIQWNITEMQEIFNIIDWGG